MALMLVHDAGFERRYVLGDGRIILIAVDEYSYDANVYTQSGEKVGHIYFRMIEDEHSSVLHITNMYLDEYGSSYKRNGIGRQCLLFVKDVSGMDITASYDDGITKDDGSHLTGDAAYFVGKMRQEGIIKGYLFEPDETD